MPRRAGPNKGITIRFGVVEWVLFGTTLASVIVLTYLALQTWRYTSDGVSRAIYLKYQMESPDQPVIPMPRRATYD
jgi:hypothetical protein